MSNIILFEGIPGSGKTTLAKRVVQYFQDKGYDFISFHEGDIHPIDLAWCSYMKKETFNILKTKYSHLHDQIMKHSKQQDDMIVTAFTKVKITNKKDRSFYNDFSKHEVYKLNNLNEFLEVHKNLYRYFNANCPSDNTYVFECVLLQNHINELILRYNKKRDFIVKYLNDLIDELTNVNLYIIHLNQKDTKKGLTKIINERTRKTMNIPDDWINVVVDCLNQQPYAEIQGYKGVAGVYLYYKDRQILERSILSMLHTTVQSFDVDNNYDEVFDSIVRYVTKHIIES